MATNIQKRQGEVISLGPDQYIATAIERGSDVATLERLFDLKAKHDAAEAKKAFIRAMQQFQAIKPDLPRSQSVSFGQGKTAYNFCPLPVIEKALRDPLSSCGLSYRFENLNRDGTFGIRCVVTHEDGHSEGTEMYAPADQTGNKNAIQGIGSTSTYLMRYTLIAAFALTTADEDNDGQTSGDMPYLRLVEMGKTLQDINALKAVLAIKEALAEDDYYTACTYIYSMNEKTLSALWVAGTKGGVFSVEERKKMTSQEFQQRKADYFAEKDK